jgi:hypothetical protein
MRAANRPISLTRGDSYTHLVRFVAGDGTTAIVKTGYTYAAQLRASPDGALLADFACTDGDATGQIWVTLAPAASELLAAGRAVWDLQETSPAGAVVTKLAGAVTVYADVTRIVEVAA